MELLVNSREVTNKLINKIDFKNIKVQKKFKKMMDINTEFISQSISEAVSKIEFITKTQEEEKFETPIKMKKVKHKKGSSNKKNKNLKEDIIITPIVGSFNPQD